MVCLGPRDPVDIAGPRPLSGVVVRPLNFTVRAPMRKPNRLTIAALVALLAPAVLLAGGAAASGALPDTPLTVSDGFFLLKTWAYFASPQLLVLALAYFSPSSRHFAFVALIALTALCTCLFGLVFFSRDPNSPMFFAFYLPLSVLVVLGVMFFTRSRGVARGSNNRWRGP